MKVAELIDKLCNEFNLDDEVIIEMAGRDFKIDDVYKDGKNDVCIYSQVDIGD